MRLDDWCFLPTEYGNFRMHDTGDEEVRLLTLGDYQKFSGSPFLRIHSSCLASEVFGARDCDCADQLDESMRIIAENGSGIIIHLHQEGRGHGLAKKIQAVRLMDEHKVDTVKSFEILGLDQDIRSYGSAVELLQTLGIRSVTLISNNPRKKKFLLERGIEVMEQRTHPIIRMENEAYLHSKNEKLGHKLPLENPGEKLQEIHFYHSSRSYGCFSNFSKHPIFLDGLIWSTTEHYYQSSKFEEKKVRDLIRLSPSPAAAKLLAKQNKQHQRDNWSDQKEEFMMNALIAKFTQHPELLERLLSTGQNRIVERPTNDSYWGEDDFGNGLNRLGVLLMNIRDSFREE